MTKMSSQEIWLATNKVFSVNGVPYVFVLIPSTRATRPSHVVMKALVIPRVGTVLRSSRMLAIRQMIINKASNIDR